MIRFEEEIDVVPTPLVSAPKPSFNSNVASMSIIDAGGMELPGCMGARSFLI